MSLRSPSFASNSATLKNCTLRLVRRVSHAFRSEARTACSGMAALALFAKLACMKMPLSNGDGRLYESFGIPAIANRGVFMQARYTLTIGTKDWSSWSLRPYMALRAIDVPFAEDLIPLRRDSTTVEVEKRTPAGRVPVLKIEENGSSHIVWDSLAICETLAERHPEARLWPADAWARAT